ncbi:hypothetical protein Dimus_025989 [Dionaea muscipula]
MVFISLFDVISCNGCMLSRVTELERRPEDPCEEFNFITLTFLFNQFSLRIIGLREWTILLVTATWWLLLSSAQKSPYFYCFCFLYFQKVMNVDNRKKFVFVLQILFLCYQMMKKPNVVQTFDTLDAWTKEMKISTLRLVVGR